MLVTKKAKLVLKQSIDKWKKAHEKLLKVKGKKKDRNTPDYQIIVDSHHICKHGLKQCPLCVQYNYTRTSCRGCPITIKTNKDYCDGTPYREFVEINKTTKTVCKSLIDAHQNMIDFMENFYKECKIKKGG